MSEELLAGPVDGCVVAPVDEEDVETDDDKDEDEGELGGFSLVIGGSELGSGVIGGGTNTSGVVDVLGG